MPSEVNNRPITNTKSASDWPLPKLQGSLPASSTEVVMSDKNVTASKSGGKHREALQDGLKASFRA